MIYMVYSRHTDLAKIGWTEDIDRRLKHFATALPVPVELFRSIDGPPVFEKKLHAIFTDLRVKGEWFQYDERMQTITVKEIDAFSGHDQICNLWQRLHGQQHPHRRLKKEFCRNGHKFSETGVINSQGQRYCRKCAKASAYAYRNNPEIKAELKARRRALREKT